MSIVNFGKVVFVDVVLNIVLFAASPLLLYFYRAEDIGYYSLLQSVVALGGMLATLRLEVVVRADFNRFVAVANQLVLIAFPSAALGVFCVYLASAFFSNSHAPIGIYVIGWMSSYFIGLSNFFSYLYVSLSRVRIVNVARSVKVLSQLLIQLFPPLIGLNFGYEGLLASVLVSSFLSLCVYYYFRSGIFDLRAASFSSSVEIVKESRGVVYCHVPAALLVSFADALLVLYLLQWSDYYAGIFFIADRLLRTPVALLGNWIRQFVLSGRLCLERKNINMVALCLIVLFGVFEVLRFFVSLGNDRFDLVLDIFAWILPFYLSQLFVSVLSAVAVKSGVDSVSVVFAALYGFGVFVVILLLHFVSSFPFHAVYGVLMCLCMLTHLVYVKFVVTSRCRSSDF